MSAIPRSGAAAVCGPNALSNNCMMARWGVRYVKRHMTVGAANKGTDWAIHSFTPFTTDAGKCLMNLREELAEYKKNAKRTMLEVIRTNANNALLAGCGNCDEQAMAAFWYLYKQGVRPLDLMACPGVHVFVVIGRVRGSDTSRIGTWGGFSAICDPWDDEAYPSIARPKLMSCIDSSEMAKTVSWHRQD